MTETELAAIVDGLLTATAEGDVVDLDAIGEAIGARLVSQDEIDLVIRGIQARRRRVETRPGGDGEAHLKQVLDAARALRSELGRAPQPSEIAARARLAVDQVKHALALARVIQR